MRSKKVKKIHGWWGIYRKKCKYYLPVLFLVILFSSVLLAQQVMSFKIVINKNNPVTKITRAEVSNIFLKKKPKWPDGEKMMPVDLVSTNPLREIFSQRVHQKSVSAIKIYWQKKIYAGTGLPPAERKNDTEVLVYIRNHSGAIGYVSANADLDSVKEIQITE
jgi:ABC-type phosphate transport system substrate-binding protein